MNKRKKNLKIINELYSYYQAINMLPPRGDGAKFEVAKEVHQVALKLFNKIDNSKDDREKLEISFMLLELCEQMILDLIDDGYTVKEMEMYE